MNTSDLITVIIPVFNTGPWLAPCLESILVQTWPSLEILVVDDGSTDDSPSIIRSFQERDPRITVITQTNQGLSAARNAALDRAHGDWIMFLDSDDSVADTFCEHAWLAAAESGADLVLFDALGVIEGTGDTFPFRSELPAGVYDKKETLLALARFLIPPNAWNKLYRRRLFEQIRFPAGENWEDCAVMHRIIDRAGQICVLHDTLYYYRNRTGSITGLAQQDLSVYSWRYLQYGKRYAYLLEKYPDIAREMTASQEETALKYCAACAISPDRQEQFRMMRARILQGEPDENGVTIPRNAHPSPKIRLARILLRFSPGLFRMAAKRLVNGRQPG